LLEICSKHNSACLPPRSPTVVKLFFFLALQAPICALFDCCVIHPRPSFPYLAFNLRLTALAPFQACCTCKLFLSCRSVCKLQTTFTTYCMAFLIQVSSYPIKFHLQLVCFNCCLCSPVRPNRLVRLFGKFVPVNYKPCRHVVRAKYYNFTRSRIFTLSICCGIKKFVCIKLGLSARVCLRHVTCLCKTWMLQSPLPAPCPPNFLFINVLNYAVIVTFLHIKCNRQNCEKRWFLQYFKVVKH
jgi:hypothetical protein